LPEKGYSYLVQEISSKLAVNTSYEKALDILGSLFPVDLPIRSLEGIVSDLSDDVAGFYDQPATPKVPVGAAITVATVDKKGVVIRKAQVDSPESVPADPEKPGKKKMAAVISTYVVQPHIRTEDEVAGEISGKAPANHRPKPACKQVWSSLTEGAEATVIRLGKAVKERLPQGNQLVCILDGERSLWALVYKYFPTAFFVLDIFHVLEYLGKAALCFHDQGSNEARKFVTERLRMLLRGKAGALIGGLKQMLTKHELAGAKRTNLEQVIGYLERNRKHMRYEICLARGYPIGSGVIEGTCRNIINDRLELTGMSWTRQGAESVMRLRAVSINGDWDVFWTYRRKSQRRRLYGNHEMDAQDIREHELPVAA
jgi:hypothetical protein